MATKAEVAEWMLEELKRVRFLEQETAVFEIARRFGSEFVYANDNGNDAIDRGVLKEFRKLSGTNVVWERGERLWRFRQRYDEPGKRMVE